MTDAIALALRVGLSFALVLGLMWLAARVFRGSLAGRGSGALEVLARQQVGRGASVAVVRVADRALVVGVTEHTVTVLGETLTDLAALTAPAAVAPGPDDVTSVAPGAPGNKPLAGSVLSPATWRQAVQALRERTVRRG